ncbi:MAG: chemotaxis protein [Negativicutes bacterium]|nr:chemotaxis protein [Negativicutes bacterium]
MEDNKGILLESGTNEFEIIEFSIDNVTYGINVAKVREVINPVPVTPIVKSHPNLDGAFTLRGKVIPLVNLARAMNVAENPTSSKFIVCEINNYFVGFKVESVDRIHRISWTQLDPAPHISGSNLVVGIVKMGDRLIILLDYEKILAEVNPDMNRKMSVVPVSAPGMIELRKAKTILIAEDSHMLRELLLGTLRTAGYNTISTEDGQEAWDKLTALVATRQPISEHIQLVITDIEMPKMDGHHLTKRIKEHEKLQELPVIIFSSLINDEMRRKGESLGAYAQITKPEIEQLINMVDKKIVMPAG